MNIAGNIINVVAIGISVACICLWMRVIMQQFSKKQKKVSAIVCDKFEGRVQTWHPGSFNPVRYTVVFSTCKGKISFNVDPSSYANYKVGKKGTLTYRGRRLINFK